MKRLLLLLPLALFATTAYTNPAPRAQDNGEVYIIAYLIEQDDEGNRVVTVNSEQSVVLGARWGTCTRGLAQAWTKNGNVYYEIDGAPVLPEGQDSRAYWQTPVVNTDGYPDPAGCIAHTGAMWRAYWRYPLGRLSPGEHQGYMLYWANHQVVDGYDLDEDGKVDHYGGVLVEIPFTIVVQ